MRRIFALLFLAALAGCGGDDTPKGKELEDLQNLSQQQADEEERAYQKSQAEPKKKK